MSKDQTQGAGSACRGSEIEVEDVAYAYEGKHGRVHALSQVSLNVKPGEFLAIVGRSGSGKSTLLRLLAGLIRPGAGGIKVHGHQVNGPPPRARFVAQDYTQSLLPWLTVEDNIRFGARHAVEPDQESDQTVERITGLVGLSHARKRYPRELSGGMQQRVAIARALASRPDVLLLDEAFGSVDALSRATLQDMVLDLWSTLGFTALLVTHDIDEAIYLADRVVVMNENGQGFAADLQVELPRPRHQVRTRELPTYLARRRVLLDHVLTRNIRQAA